MKKENPVRGFFSAVALFSFIIVLSASLSAQLNPPKDNKEAAPKEDKKDDKKAATVKEDDGGWKVRDFKPYVTALKELEKLNKEYSENLLKLAMDEYATGLDILEDMENDVVKVTNQTKNKKFLNERWYWQEIDRKNQEQRYISRKKFTAKMKAVTYFTKSINSLDEIQSVEVKQKPEYINFQSRLFQIYVSTQYDLNNLKPCIPILERYISLSDKNKKDVWAYKYLASCYGYMEAVLAKYKQATEDEINIYKTKKNRSMLQATEMKYGVESPHYKKLQDVVEVDEKKSERINDFK